LRLSRTPGSTIQRVGTGAIVQPVPIRLALLAAARVSQRPAMYGLSVSGREADAAELVEDFGATGTPGLFG